MSSVEIPVYQIIAVSQSEQIEVGRARLGNKPFHVGSGDSATLQLQGDDIAPIHARVLLTGNGRVLVTNMGDHKTIAVDGVSINAFVPTHWQPQRIVQIGMYHLRLMPITSDVSEVIASGDRQMPPPTPNLSSDDFAKVEGSPSVVDTTLNFASENTPGDDDDWIIAPKQESARDGTMLFEDMGDEFNYDVLDREMPVGQNEATSRDEALISPAKEIGWDVAPEVAPLDDATNQDESLNNVSSVAPPSRKIARNPDPEQPPTEQFNQTPLKPIDDELRAQIKAPSAGDIGVSHGTLPRVWYYAGYIGAQLLHSPLRLVPGERVRVPISIQNRDSHPLSLHLVTAGVPRDWLELPVLPIKLAPREIRLLDLILMTPVTYKQTKAELLIRLSDTARDDTILTLAQEVVFKTNPNIVGRLQPAQMTDRDPGLLYLQNHTQSSIQVFITHHLEAEDVRLTLGETQFNLPPGQVVSIPLHFEVRSRATFGAKRYRFSVVVAQNRRAALDFPGEVTILPRLRAGHILFLLTSIIAVMLIGLLLIAGRGGATAVVVSPSTVLSSPTSQVEQFIPTTIEPTKPPA